MIINASKQARAHWQSKSICGQRTWKRDSYSRHLPQGGGGASAAPPELGAPLRELARDASEAACAAQWEAFEEEVHIYK